MSRRANPYDNAKAESFMKTLKVEAIYLEAYETFEDVTRGSAVRGSTRPADGQISSLILSTRRGALHIGVQKGPRRSTGASCEAMAVSLFRSRALELGEIQIADCLQCFGERTVPQVFRQSIQPCGIFDLCFDETGRRGCSTLSPTASIAFVTMAFLRTAIVRRSSRFAGIFWRHRPRRRLHLPLTIGSGIAN